MTVHTNCRDVREWLSAMSRGNAGLTERALVEVHLAQCAQCRQELEQLQQTTLRRRVIWRQAPPAVIRKALEAARPSRLLAPLRQPVHVRNLVVALASAGAILALVACAIYLTNQHHDQPAVSAPASLETPRTEFPPAPPIGDPNKRAEPWPTKPIPRSSAVSVSVPESAELSRVVAPRSEPKQLAVVAPPAGQRNAPASSPPHTIAENRAPAPALKLDPRQGKAPATDSVIITPSATSLSEAEPAESAPVSPVDVIGLLQVTDRDALARSRDATRESGRERTRQPPRLHLARAGSPGSLR